MLCCRRLVNAKKSVWLAIAFCIILGMPVAAQAPSTLEAPNHSGIWAYGLPTRIAGAWRADITDYEKDTPGLGYGVNYRLPGWDTDIYFYDLKQSSISDDPFSGVVKAQLDKAKSDVFAYGRAAKYSNVVAKNDYKILDSTGHARFICSSFGYFNTRMNADVDSYLCVTGWKGNFVKIRMTTSSSDTSAAESRRFINAWIDVLWPAFTGPALAPNKGDTFELVEALSWLGFDEALRSVKPKLKLLVKPIEGGISSNIFSDVTKQNDLDAGGQTAREQNLKVAVSVTGVTQYLPDEELKSLGTKFQAVWKRPLSDSHIIQVRLLLGKDGNLKTGPFLITHVSESFGLQRDRVIRAILKAQPYDMFKPEAYENGWKDIEITFDPTMPLLKE